MARRLAPAIGLIALLALAACASRLNPLNWFGGAREERIAVTDAPPEVSDPRPLVDEIVDVRVEQVPSGAIVTVTGRATRQGFWEPALVESGREDGSIVYTFRVLEPLGATPTGSSVSREIVTAIALSNSDLADIRQIVVEGARNRLIVRR
ncbi:MAG: hypothetical protein AAF914_14210 [Pseudomonadota bacterium]